MTALGTWFAAVGQRGDDNSILVGRGVAGAELQWYALSHARYDGIGALGTVLSRCAGARVALPTVPDDDPGAPQCELATGAELLGLRAGWPPRLRRRRPLPVVAWWSEAELAALRAAARARDLTVGTLLLWTTHQALRVEAERDGMPLPPDGAWMFAVNLRRRAFPATMRGNHASFVVAAPGGRSGAALHADIYRRLGRGEHWANALHLARAAALGPSLLGVGLELLRGTPIGFLGLFSNLGAWDVPALPDDAWCISAPPTDQTPLTVALVCVNGRLSMCGRSQWLSRDFVARVLARTRDLSLGS